MQAGHLEMVVCMLAGNLLHRWEGGSRMSKRWRSELMRKRRRSDENRLLCIAMHWAAFSSSFKLLQCAAHWAPMICFFKRSSRDDTGPDVLESGFTSCSDLVLTIVAIFVKVQRIIRRCILLCCLGLTRWNV